MGPNAPPTPARPGAVLVAGFLLIALGLARGAGGVALLTDGPAAVAPSRATETDARVAAASLLGTAAASFLAAYGVVSLRTWGWSAARAALAVFVAAGALNGTLLFGVPRPAGLLGNVAVAVGILAVVESARRQTSSA